MLLGLLSLFIGQIFGNSIVPIGTKITSPFTGPVLFVFFRFVIGTILLFIIFLTTKRKKIKRHEYKDFALLGFLLMINVVLFTVAIPHTTVIMSTLIYSITPILVGIGAHFFLSETFDRQKLFGLIISFIGLLFLISQSIMGLQQRAFGEPFGNILICISMIGYSYYIIHSRKTLHKKDNMAIQTTFLTFVFTSLFIFIILLLGVFLGEIPLKPLPATGISGFFIVGIGSVIQYLFLQIGIKKTNAFTASLFQYTGPFIAASITIPLLHEQVTVRLIVGGILILTGVFIATTYGKFKKSLIIDQTSA